MINDFSIDEILKIALEATSDDDIDEENDDENVDLLADDAEEKAFGKDSQTTKPSEEDKVDNNKDDEDLEEENDENELDSNEDEDDAIDNNDTPEEDSSEDILKKKAYEKLYYLYDTISSQISSLSQLPHERNLLNSSQYQEILKKFTILKNIIYKFLTDPTCKSKDYVAYTKWFVTADEAHSICLKLLETYLDNNSKESKEADIKPKQTHKNLG